MTCICTEYIFRIMKTLSLLKLKNISHIQRRFARVRRKYPINPDEEKDLPVFKYTVSKETYRRLFTWGNFKTGALGIPFLKESEKDQRYSFTFPKRLGFGEKHEITSIASGFGFSVFAVNSDSSQKIFGTGINADSQIGYHEVRTGHPLEVLFYPKPIDLPFKDPKSTEVKKLSAGRAHLVILTDEGIFTLGNNAFGQCGRRIIDDENYHMSHYIHHLREIDGKEIVDVECGQDHSLAITEHGDVYSCGWGADGQTGLGHYDNCPQFTKVKGDIESERIVQVSSRSDFVLALNDKGEVFGWGNCEYGQMPVSGGEQQLHTPRHIKMLEPLGKIKSVASAGSFCVVTNSDGQVFSWGYGLLGTGPNVQQSNTPVHIPDVLFGKNDFQPNSVVQKVVCGLFCAGAITNFGDLYVWGRNKSGCLGLGHEKDQYFPLKVAISGTVETVTFGVDHTIALCKPFI